MAILDKFIPVYYNVLRMGIQQADVGLVAVYDIVLISTGGDRVGTLNHESTLTSQEKQAIAAIFQRDKAAFEAATGLTEYSKPEE